MDKNGVLLATSSVDTEEMVWLRYKEGPLAGNRDDRNRLATMYQDLSAIYAGKIARRLPKYIDTSDIIEDLTSAGYFGLLDAIEGFDLTRGIKFATYAGPRIFGSMLDYLRSIDVMPRLVRERAKVVQAASEQLKQRLGHDPTDEEIKAELNLDPDQYEKVMRDAAISEGAPLSLDREVHYSGYRQSRHSDVIADSSPHPIQGVETEDLRRFITKGLTEQQALILVLHELEGVQHEGGGRHTLHV